LYLFTLQLVSENGREEGKGRKKVIKAREKEKTEE
jgi:hypothetical protein